MTAGFIVYTSSRLEELLEALATHLGQDPLPALQRETIVVPSQGLARWVQLRLAERTGIAAGLHLPFPGAFLQQLSRAAAIGSQPATLDLFAKDILVWRLMRLLADQTLQADLGPAAAYCTGDPDGRKRFQLCERIAACFDDYQLYRDDLLLRAARGDDLADCGPHGPWQARLWRALLRDAGLLAERPTARTTRKGKPQEALPPLLFPEPLCADGPSAPASVSPAHRLDALRTLLADPARARALLPGRLAVFGAGTLAPAFLDLLARIAEHVPVALFAPEPTAEYAGDLRRSRAGNAGGNPLLARWGVEAREFRDLLVDVEAKGVRTGFHHIELRDLADRGAPAARPTLLQCLQQDITDVADRGGAGPDSQPPLALHERDDSLRVHDCHSPQRELEVVRDQILAAFREDPELEPHDVLVLVPDIDRYAPYAHAVFGPVADYLPFHAADRNPANELPLCSTLFAALQLAQDRLHVFDVLHLLEEPAVRRRFGLFASDLPILRNRCDLATIRWGLDGASRERQFRMPAFEENAWLPGLDRLLLGACTGPQDDLVAGVLPVADTTDGRDELLARFIGYARSLFALLQPLQRPHTLPVWADLLDGLLAGLFQAASADDTAAIAQLQRAIANLRGLAGGARHREPTAPIVLQDWLRQALQQGSASRGFLTGAVTIAAMQPMRTVPTRLLFLCGLDDQSFPRRDHPSPFDLLHHTRRPGDRSLRLDDRQLFLDALLAARERLHITFVGHSQKDDSQCAPSVLLAELLDHVDRSCRPPAGYARPRDFVVVNHPLQAWSLRYRTGDDARLFTFARDDLQQAALAPLPESPFCTSDLPADEAADAELPLASLLEFWWHPCRSFLRRLGVRVPRDSDADDETEPFAIDPLDRWRLQHQTVQRALRGDPPPRDAHALARAAGLLPVGGHGAVAWTDVEAETRQFLHEVLGHGKLGSAAVRVQSADVVIRGEIDGVGEQQLVYARIANRKPKDHLRAWLLHVVAAVARSQGASDLPAGTVLIARDGIVRLLPLPPEAARGALTDLLAGYQHGQRRPLPFFELSSHAYGKARKDKKPPDDALRRARREWLPRAIDNYARSDSEDAAIALCMRGSAGIDLPEFGTWAERIWTTVHGYSEVLE